MRVYDLISPEVKQKLNYNNQPKQRRNRKKNNHKRKQQEQLSEYQIKHLMGQYRPTYTRVRGAVRQR